MSAITFSNVVIYLGVNAWHCFRVTIRIKSKKSSFRHPADLTLGDCFIPDQVSLQYIISLLLEIILCLCW